MKHADPKVRIQAIRASESLYKAGDKSFASDYRAMLKDPDTDVVIQAMLTINLRRIPQYADLIRTHEGREPGAWHQGDRRPAAQAAGRFAGSAAVAGRYGGDGPEPARPKSVECSAAATPSTRSCAPPATAPDGKGAPMGGATDGTTLAPNLVGVPRVLGNADYITKVLLFGLTGELDGKTYPAA